MPRGSWHSTRRLVCQYCSAVRALAPSEEQSMLFTATGDGAAWKRTLLQSKSDWEAVHGASPMTSIPGFAPQRIYCDVLHIMDLQVIPDCLLSSLLELSDQSNRRQTALSTLQDSYLQWCSENRASKRSRFVLCLLVASVSLILILRHPRGCEGVVKIVSGKDSSFSGPRAVCHTVPKSFEGRRC